MAFQEDLLNEDEQPQAPQPASLADDIKKWQVTFRKKISEGDLARLKTPDSRTGRFGDMSERPAPPSLTRAAMRQAQFGPAEPPPAGSQASGNTSTSEGHQPGPTAASDVAVSSGSYRGSTNQPRIPSPRSTDIGTPPIIGGQPSGNASPSLLGGVRPQPARPNVMPTRSDFPEKKLPLWEKAAAIGAAPFVPGVSVAILTSPRRNAERQYEGAVKDWQLQQQEAGREQEGELRRAQIRNINSEIKARENPKPEKPGSLTQQESDAVDELVAQGVPRVDAIGRVKGAGQKPPTPTFEEQTYQEWVKTHPGGTRLQFEKERSAVTQKPERPEKPQRMMGVTPDGKVIEIQPGMSLPPGTKSLGGELTLTAKTEQGEQAGQSAVAYANDYLTGKQWTGPGDEALMEKFFEMAKPSSGFRMTQAQIEVLQRSRDLMGSITAKAKHAFTPEAPWFSDTQRNQIVKTMNDLARSRQEVKPGAAGGGGTGDVVRFSDGGRNFAIPAGQVNEFLKDHPNAQRR